METKFDWVDDFKYIQIDSNRLPARLIKNFTYSNLLLNNISYNLNSKIYLLYLNEIKSYQILVFDEKFDPAYLECFSKSLYLNEYETVLFIYKQYMVLYKDKKPYYFQKNSININNDELRNYFENNLGLNIEYIEVVDDASFTKYFEKYKKEDKKSYLNNINKTKDYFLIIYLIYIVFLIITIFYLFTFNKENISNKDIKEINIDNKVKVFKPFTYLYSDILDNLQKNKLNLNSFIYEKNSIKFIFHSTNKKNIYDFLLIYKNRIKNSSILYNKELKAFVCEVGLKK